MQNVLKFAVAALVLLFAPSVVTAQQSSELIVGESFDGYTGWKTFCKDYPAECNLPKMDAVKIALTPEVMDVLNQVNNHVNSAVQFKIDIEHWGLDNPRYTFKVKDSPGVDKWDFAEPDPDGIQYGDCEDYANLKKKLLIERGFPRSALLLTVVTVQDPNPDVKTSSKNESHMVLMVRTEQGDFLLDDVTSTNEVLRWSKTKFVFETRQSAEDPNVWVLLQSPIVAEAK